VLSRRPAGGVVIAHPHPLMGGTMAQPVVYRVARACRERGFASLRFNFRGVGQSRGRYSGSEEYRDVEAALAFLRGRVAAAAGDEQHAGRRCLSGWLVLVREHDGRTGGRGGRGVRAGSALIALVVRWEDGRLGSSMACLGSKGRCWRSAGRRTISPRRSRWSGHWAT